MVRGSAVLLCLGLFVSLLATPVLADRSTEDLQSKVIERFDSPSGDKDVGKYEYRQNHRWIVRGSKFVTEGFPKFSWVKSYPQAAFSSVPEGEEYRSLGVQAAFDRQGYNYLEFIPVEDKDGENGKPIEKGITIPGRLKRLDFWAWGSNYKYYMEVQVRDYRGMVHTLRAGDLNYVGWKNLKVEIPSSIPQDVKYLPQQKGLELIKIVLWTYPEEKVSGFSFYIDQIKAMTDMFEQPYDGSGLTDAKNVENIWTNGVGTSDPKATKGGN